MKEASNALIPSERAAQQTEKVINGELRAALNPKKK